MECEISHNSNNRKEFAIMPHFSQQFFILYGAPVSCVNTKKEKAFSINSTCFRRRRATSQAPHLA